MEILNAYPPNYDQITERFPYVKEIDNAVFTYGDTLFTPGLSPDAISDDLMIHEKVHTKQQGQSVTAWWERYLLEPDFRLSQELEAYREQYQYIKARRSNKMASYYAMEFARALSSPMYDLGIDFGRAEKLIKAK